MSDKHLLNTIAFLERNCAKYASTIIVNAYRFADTLQGEIALFQMEQEIENLEETPLEDFLPSIYDDLIKERKRRKI